MKSVKDKILKWFSINFPQLVFQWMDYSDVDSTENGEKLVYIYKEDLRFINSRYCNIMNLNKEDLRFINSFRYCNIWNVGLKRTNATIFSISDTDDFDSIFKKYGGVTFKNSRYFNGRKFPKDMMELELELMA